MSEKLTTWLGWLTLVAVLGALWLLFGEDPTKKAGARGDLLFPEFGEQVTTAARIQLKGPTDASSETVTLMRMGTEWRVSERGDYPADTARIGRLLRGLVRSKLREPKTTNPDRFADVGLGDRAHQLTVQDEAGKDLVRLDLGRFRGVSDERTLTFVYKPGDSRVWVADALSEVDAEPAHWLRPGLLALNEARIKRVTLGDVTFTRGESGAFELEDLAEGEQAQADFILSEPARLLAALNFTDVRLAGSGNTTDSDTFIFSLETNDGLMASFTLVDPVDGWVRLEARYDDTHLTSDGSAVLGEGTGDAASEVADITSRTQGFEFQLDASDLEQINRDRTAFVRPAPVTVDQP